MFKILIAAVLERDNVVGPMLEFHYAKSEPAVLGDLDLILVISLISDFKKLPEKIDNLWKQSAGYSIISLMKRPLSMFENSYFQSPTTDTPLEVF
jgi:hypothetical protein